MKTILFYPLFLFLTVKGFAQMELIGYQAIGSVTIESIQGLKNESLEKQKILASAINAYFTASKLNFDKLKLHLRINFGDRDTLIIHRLTPASPHFKIEGSLSGDRVKKLLAVINSLVVSGYFTNKSVGENWNDDSLLLVSGPAYLNIGLSNATIDSISNIVYERTYKFSTTKKRVVYKYKDGMFYFQLNDEVSLRLNNIFQLVSVGKNSVLILDTNHSCYLYDCKRMLVSERYEIPYVNREVEQIKKSGLFSKSWDVLYNCSYDCIRVRVMTGISMRVEYDN